MVYHSLFDFDIAVKVAEQMHFNLIVKPIGSKKQKKKKQKKTGSIKLLSTISRCVSKRSS